MTQKTFDKYISILRNKHNIPFDKNFVAEEKEVMLEIANMANTIEKRLLENNQNPDDIKNSVDRFIVFRWAKIKVLGFYMEKNKILHQTKEGKEFIKMIDSNF